MKDTLEMINREEFDRRLEQHTQQMRQQRLALEARTAELEELIGRYASVLKRLEAEAEAEPEADTLAARREELRHVLIELAGRTSVIQEESCK